MSKGRAKRQPPRLGRFVKNNELSQAFETLHKLGVSAALPTDFYVVCRHFGRQMADLMASWGGESDHDHAIRSVAGDPLMLELFATAYERGFMLALLHHAKALNIDPDVIASLEGRERGVRLGHVTQSLAREARYQRIRDTLTELESAGKPCTYDAVAAACECSRSTVERAINSRLVKRKKR